MLFSANGFHRSFWSEHECLISEIQLDDYIAHGFNQKGEKKWTKNKTKPERIWEKRKREEQRKCRENTQLIYADVGTLIPPV